MRLIDANEIRKKAVPHTRGEHGYNANIRKWAVLVGDIDDAPTIEAELVKHGRWVEEIEFGYDGSPNGCHFKCSLCNEIEYETTPYCPNCGAKMDGGAEDG